jgi:hypothetical protein
MRIPILGIEIDERFLEHRRRSTSIASVVGAWVAGGIFVYRYFVAGIFDWGLFAVIATMAAVKLAVLTYYRLTD